MPSNVSGKIAVRRLFRRLPDEVRGELGNAMREAGPELANAIRSKAPRGKTLRLFAGIDWRFYPSSMRLRVGFLGKRVNRKLFYARILEFGRKGQTVTAKRARRGGSGRKGAFDGAVSTYRLRVKARAPQHFVYGPGTDLKRVLGRTLNGMWDRILRRFSGGSDA